MVEGEERGKGGKIERGPEREGPEREGGGERDRWREGELEK